MYILYVERIFFLSLTVYDVVKNAIRHALRRFPSLGHYYMYARVGLSRIRVYVYITLRAKEVFELFPSPSDVLDLIAAPTSFHRMRSIVHVVSINSRSHVQTIFIMLSRGRYRPYRHFARFKRNQFRIYTCVQTIT